MMDKFSSGIHFASRRMPSIDNDVFYRQVTIESISDDDDELKTSSCGSSSKENVSSFFLHPRRSSNRAEMNFNENPEIFIRPKMIEPIVCKQIVTVKFLKPPEIRRGSLIIHKVHSRTARRPAPSVVRQIASRPLSPPTLILREKPPPIPPRTPMKVSTEILPSIPVPARSLIAEKVPEFLPKSVDVYIERWIPYKQEKTTRQVIVQPAEPAVVYPSARNSIVNYDQMKTRIVRRIRYLGISNEDPTSYVERYGDSLLDTEQLLLKVKELGIDEDLLNDVSFREITSTD